MSKFKPSKFWYVVGALLAANVAIFLLLRQSVAVDFAKLYFFDVGQGDAIYLRTPQGNDILIDGGPSDAVLGKLGAVMPFADRQIEFLILTHPHADHVAGLIEVLKRYRVTKIMFPKVAHESATYREFLDAAQKEGAEIARPKLGQRVFLDEFTVLDVLYPVTGEFAQVPADINDVSVVARLSLGKSQVLLTGDAGKDIESLMLGWNLPVQAEVLKIGHHGSRHSSLPQFVDRVNPEMSVVSVGKNSYGHPHEEVLGLFVARGETQLLRTDEYGDVIFALYPDRVELLR